MNVTSRASLVSQIVESACNVGGPGYRDPGFICKLQNLCSDRMESIEDKWEKRSQIYLWNANDLNQHEKLESFIIISTTTKYK